MTVKISLILNFKKEVEDEVPTFSPFLSVLLKIAFSWSGSKKILIDFHSLAVAEDRSVSVSRDII